MRRGKVVYKSDGEKDGCRKGLCGGGRWYIRVMGRRMAVENGDRKGELDVNKSDRL